MIISRTPFRVSLFGGGTDYPAWFKEHGGAVLGTTIDKYCYIAARYLPPYFEHKSRIVYAKEEWVKNNKEIEHPAVRECLKFLGITEGVEISHQSDLLAKKGMGASSTFVVGLLHALMSFRQWGGITKEILAQRAIWIEQDWIKENVGCQDQYHAAYGGFNYLKFHPDGLVERTTLSNGHLLQPYLMLFDTGTHRIASEIAKVQIEQIPHRQGELHAMHSMVAEAVRFLNEGKVMAIAPLLNTSWSLKKRLSDKITTPRIDAIYDTARKAGALGGKLLGAGGGGYLLLFVEPTSQQSVMRALDKLIYVPFKFEETGSQIIFRDEAMKQSERFSGAEPR